MAQMVERLLSKPEIYSSNLDICKILSTNCTIEKDEIKEKEARKSTSDRSELNHKPPGQIFVHLALSFMKVSNDKLAVPGQKFRFQSKPNVLACLDSC